MLQLPPELQMIIMESIGDYDALVSLYDSLPTSADFTREVLLKHIFAALHDTNAKQLQTLEQCRDAVLEMRDLISVESLSDQFSRIVGAIDTQIAALERGVSFRGITHPSQGRTMLKKNNMMSQHRTTNPRNLRGRVEKVEALDQASAYDDSTNADKTVPMWMDDNGQVCLRRFRDNLYKQQLDMLQNASEVRNS